MNVSKFAILTALCAQATAQTGVLMTGNASHNGVTVNFETRLEPSAPSLDGGFTGGSLIDNKGIHRHLGYNSLHKFFGYDLQVTPAPQHGSYVLTVSPLSITPARIKLKDSERWQVIAIPGYPAPQTVREGDTVAIEMFSNPATGQKITDYIHIPSSGDIVQGSGKVRRVQDRPRKAPELVINLQDGRTLPLSSLRGKTVAVVFLLTTCPHCQGLCAILADIQKDYAAKGVQFVGDAVETNAKDALPAFTRSYSKGAFPIGWGSRDDAGDFLNRKSSIFYAPSIAFIDKDGVIQSQFIGNEDFFRDQDKNIRAELDRILSASSHR
jgi:thiol-disulfide isomerase/thioredoxin